MPDYRIAQGDALALPLEDASIDSIVTDPPYGLEFMGKDWDAPWKQTGGVLDDPADAGGFQDGSGGNPYSRSRVRYGIGAAFQDWTAQWAAEAYRVLKPGGYLLAFGGTRTYHRAAAGIEDAGFEIRDCVLWLYGSGFPKGRDISKGVDQALGKTAERPVIGQKDSGLDKGSGTSVVLTDSRNEDGLIDVTGPATPEAAKWVGWNTALKPGYEPVVVARKPLEGNVAENVLEHGVGGMNIDGCRIGDEVVTNSGVTGGPLWRDSFDREDSGDQGKAPTQSTGRFPTNVLFDAEAAQQLDEEVGDLGGSKASATAGPYGQDLKYMLAYGIGDGRAYGGGGKGAMVQMYGDAGGPSRFFYQTRPDPEDSGDE